MAVPLHWSLPYRNISQLFFLQGLIANRLCWFPSVMRRHTSKWGVEPEYSDYRDGRYEYRLKAYMKYGKIVILMLPVSEDICHCERG